MTICFDISKFPDLNLISGISNPILCMPVFTNCIVYALKLQNFLDSREFQPGLVMNTIFHTNSLQYIIRALLVRNLLVDFVFATHN